MRKKQKAILSRLSDVIRSNLSKMQRLKINGLVVIEVHQRDIIDKLYKVGCNDTNSFDWLAQLRFYWEKVINDSPFDCLYLLAVFFTRKKTTAS